jgi:hypothetical protein
MSIAYAQAVASAARCSLEIIRVDYQGIDATIKRSAKHDTLDVSATHPKPVDKLSHEPSCSRPITTHDSLRVS